MNRKLIPVIIANLFAVSLAVADETTPVKGLGYVWTGEVGLGALGTNTNADYRTINPINSGVQTAPPTRDAAKFNEYRDLKNNGIATGTFDITGRGERSYLNLFGENINRDDQYINLQGGMYDKFKYRLFDDRMVHNLSWQLLTPFSGAGTTLLTLPPGSTGAPGGPDANPNNWNMFDASLKKENLGGYFEFSNNSPWYLRLDANQQTTKGIQASSAPFTFSSGAGSIDLPMPIDYTTKNYSVETGYSAKRGLINANFSQSFFNNGNLFYYWQDPKFSNGITSQSEASNSVLSKIGLNGTLRQLPFNSTLSSRLSYSQLTSSVGLDGPYTQNLTAAGPTYGVGNATPGRFDGKIVTTNGNFSLSSNPYKNVDTKVHWNWYHRANQSPLVTYAGIVPGGEGYGYGKVSFLKNDFGLDLGYRLNPENRVGVGASQTSINRTTLFNPIYEPSKTIDNLYYVEYSNSMLDRLTGRGRYERVNRMSGDWYTGSSTGAGGLQNLATMANPAYFRPWDTANYHQDRVKLSFDAVPVELMDAGLQLIYKVTNYDASNYGIKQDNRQEVDLNVSYGDPNRFKVNFFADFESVQYTDFWYVGALQGTPSAANFNLDTKARNTNKMAGVSGDWPVNEKLSFKAAYIYIRTTGTVDFLQNSTATTNGLFTQTGGYAGGIMPYTTDNATKQTVTLSGKYSLNKNWSLTGLYAYEKYSIRDDQMYGYGGGYAYVANMTGALTSIFNGAFQNPSYTAQIFRLMANYKF